LRRDGLLRQDDWRFCWGTANSEGHCDEPKKRDRPAN
jgi:hypothetical protein